MTLLKEIILEPRWDEKEFELIKKAVLNILKQQKANPNVIAGNEFTKLIFGPQNVLSNNILGTEASVNSITMDDLKKYYNNYLSPSVSTFHFVGAIKKEEALKPVQILNTGWTEKTVRFPALTATAAPAKSTIYFYNVPGAKQSVIRFGYPALKATDPDYYPAQVMNYILGGGGFASKFTQQLREGKGYTYGIGSAINGSEMAGNFEVYSSVRSNVTYESVQLIKDILQNFGKDYSQQDLDVTQSFLLKSNAREFETMSAKLDMLKNISAYGWPYDYAKQRQNIVKNMTVDKIRALSTKYIKPEKMYYVIVGDAETQMKKLQQIGFGEPVLISNQD